jgi:hypothetical protein
MLRKFDWRSDLRSGHWRRRIVALRAEVPRGIAPKGQIFKRDGVRAPGAVFDSVAVGMESLLRHIAMNRGSNRRSPWRDVGTPVTSQDVARPRSSVGVAIEVVRTE